MIGSIKKSSQEVGKLRDEYFDGENIKSWEYNGKDRPLGRPNGRLSIVI